MGNTLRGVPYIDLTDPADIAAGTQEMANWINDNPGIKAMTTVTRNALSADEKWAGRVIWNVTEGEHQKWNGAAWSSLSADLSAYQALSEKGAASGYAPLGADSKVPAANLPAGGMTKIDEVVLGAAAADITFSAIPATYRHLKVVFSGRGAAASSSRELRVRFNGDAGGNYDRESLRGNDTTAAAFTSAGGTYIGGMEIAGDSAPAGRVGAVSIDIPDYRGTTFHKALLATCFAARGTTGPDLFVFTIGGLWRSTAAITSVTLLLETGNFMAGSVATLYGMG